jgi:hypothetical protein
MTSQEGQQGLLAFGNDHDPAGPAAPGPSGEREQLMAEHSITYDGRHYQFGDYRYDRLADAVSYSLLRRSMPPGSNAVDLADHEPRPEETEPPDPSNPALDAVAYARVQRREQG